MFQVTFSKQSLSELNSLSQTDQLSLIEKLSSLSNDILTGENLFRGYFFKRWKNFLSDLGSKT